MTATLARPTRDETDELMQPYLDLAYAKLEEHGLHDWGVAYEYAATSRAGLCDYAAREIVLSTRIFLVRELAENLDTVLHEVAHALTPGHRHDRVWRYRFLAIGGSGDRCYTMQPEQKANLGLKYTSTCHCGHVLHRARCPRSDRWHTCIPQSAYTQENKLVWTTNY